MSKSSQNKDHNDKLDLYHHFRAKNPRDIVCAGERLVVATLWTCCVTTFAKMHSCGMCVFYISNNMIKLCYHTTRQILSYI